MKNVLRICIVITGVILLGSLNSNAQKPALNCDYWQAKVDPKIKVPAELSGPVVEREGLKEFFKPQKEGAGTYLAFSDLNSGETFFAIECILKLQGNKTDAGFSGTRADVSQLFDKNASVEVAALYYISYIFSQRWGHAGAAVLVDGKFDQKNEYGKGETVQKAFESYRMWFKKVKEIGLEEARKQKLDPLDGSGVRWY